jgi:hypothetical protein
MYTYRLELKYKAANVDFSLANWTSFSRLFLPGSTSGGGQSIGISGLHGILSSCMSLNAKKYEEIYLLYLFIRV